MPPTPTNVFDLIYPFISSEEFIAGLIGLVSGTIATFVAPWTKWHFKEKELKRESRIQRISTWREEPSKFDSVSDFYRTPLYNELVAHIPEKEKKGLFGNSSVKVSVFGDVVAATDLNSRIIARFHKVISEIEKEWRIV